MAPTHPQQLHRCARALRRAEQCLPMDSPLRMSALLDAQEELDHTIGTLRRHPRPRAHPAAMALLTLCVGMFAVVVIETGRMLTAARPAAEIKKP